MNPNDLRAKYRWKKVEAPKAWRPAHNGEELTGYYGGTTKRNGQYGQYEVVLVHVPRRGTFMISGVRILQLVAASGIDRAWPIRVVFVRRVPLGEDETGKPKEMKDFEVYVAEGDPVSEDLLPLVLGSVPVDDGGTTQ